MTHLHVERHSTDCDGSYVQEFVHDGDLWNVGVHHLLELTLNGLGYYEIEPFEDGDETRYRLRAGAGTEEGGWEIEARECDNNDCNLNYRLNRDLRAEEAGY